MHAGSSAPPVRSNPSCAQCSAVPWTITAACTIEHDPPLGSEPYSTCYYEGVLGSREDAMAAERRGLEYSTGDAELKIGRSWKKIQYFFLLHGFLSHW